MSQLQIDNLPLDKTKKEKSKKDKKPRKVILDLFKANTPFQFIILDKNKKEEYLLERSILPEKTIESKKKTLRTILTKKDVLAKVKDELSDSLDLLDDLFNETIDLTEEDEFEDDLLLDMSDGFEDNLPTEEVNSDDIDTDENRNADDNNVSTSVRYNLKHQGNYAGDYVYFDHTIVYDLLVSEIYGSVKKETGVVYLKNPDVIKLEAGDPSTVENITLIINHLTMFNIDDAFKTSSDIETISRKYFFKEIFVSPSGKLTVIKDKSGRIVQEIFDNKDYTITRNRFTSRSAKSLYPRAEYVFHGVELGLDYSKYEAYNLSTEQLKRVSNTFSSRCIYLPKPQALIEKYGINMSYVNDCNYEIIDTEEKLKRMVEDCKNKMGDTGVVAYDAETTGLRFRRFATNKDILCTHSLSWEDGQSVIIPVRMKYVQNIEPEIANKYLRTILEVNPILAHNGNADVRFLTGDNINLNLQEDTLHLIKHVLPFVTNYKEVGFGRYLDDLCKKMFGYEMIDMKKMVYDPSNATFDFSIVNEDYLIYYGCPDTDLCRRLWKVLRAKLNPQQLIPYKNTVRFAKHLAISSSYSGLGINEKLIYDEIDRSEKLLKRLQDIIYAYTGEDRTTLGLTSPVQKTQYLFGKLGATIQEAGKSADAKLSADKAVVNKLAGIKLPTPTDHFKQDILDVDGKPLIKADTLNSLKYPFCKLVRTHDDLQSNVNSNLNRMIKNSQEQIFYPDFSVGKTDTWRTIDGIQTMKNELKIAIVPPNNTVTQQNNENWYWASTDYRTQEICLAANNSNDWKLISILQDVEADLHSETAADLFETKPYQVTKAQRSNAKTCNFLLAYGGKAYALGQKIYNTDLLTEEQLVEARDLFDLYCYKRAEMLKPLQMAKVFVSENGYIVNKVGYKMVYPSIIKKNKMIDEVFDTNVLENNITPEIDYDQKRIFLGQLLNACGNYPIQSWAAGILMEVYHKLIQKIKDDGYENDIFVPLTVHDEVGTAFRSDKIHPYYIIHLQLETLVDDMSYLNKPQVAPLYVGIGFGPNWYTAKDDPAELPIKLQYILQKEYLEGKCPTREEILEEGIYEHFIRRKKEYTRDRCIEALKEMYDNKHYKRTEVEYILSQVDMFTGKQMQANFDICKPKSSEIDIEKILRVIYEIPDDQPIPEDITYEEGEPIQEDDAESEDKNVEFFFVQGKIHERINVSEKYLQINLANLNASVISNIKEYMDTLITEEYHIHNKTIVFIEQNGQMNYTGKNILSIPTSFADTFTNLINGSPIKYDYTNPNKILTSKQYARLGDNCIIINSEFIDKAIEQNKMDQVDNILKRFTSTATVAIYPIKVENKLSLELSDTGLKMISLKYEIIEEINNLLD